jgi:GT2 family glycosyltransferase
MNDIVVIIPTMWKYKPFYDFLPDLIESYYVNEVIVINNDSINAPRELVDSIASRQFYKFKTKVFQNEDGSNMGVNPAWNLGVDKSGSSIICLLNDDVIFDMRLFRKVIKFFDENPDAGVVGLNPSTPEFNQRKNVSGEITFEEWQPNMHTYGFGSLMFLQRKHYIPVPNGLKIYYGDNWLFDIQLRVGRKNYMINDLAHYTPFAQTTKTLPNLQETLEQEGVIFRQSLQSFHRPV